MAHGYSILLRWHHTYLYISVLQINQFRSHGRFNFSKKSIYRISLFKRSTGIICFLECKDPNKWLQCKRKLWITIFLNINEKNWHYWCNKTAPKMAELCFIQLFHHIRWIFWVKPFEHQMSNSYPFTNDTPLGAYESEGKRCECVWARSGESKGCGRTSIPYSWMSIVVRFAECRVVAYWELKTLFTNYFCQMIKFLTLPVNNT